MPHKHSTQGQSHKAPLKQLYISSAILGIMWGQNPGVVLDSGWGDGGYQGQGKTPKEILEGRADTRRCGRFSQGGKRVMDTK